jgi:hypothetical protein
MVEIVFTRLRIVNYFYSSFVETYKLKKNVSNINYKVEFDLHYISCEFYLKIVKYR